MPSQAPQPIKPTTPTPEAKLVYMLNDRFTNALLKRVFRYIPYLKIQQKYPVIANPSDPPSPFSKKESAHHISNLLTDLSCMPFNFSRNFEINIDYSEGTEDTIDCVRDYVTALDTILHCDEFRDPDIYPKIIFPKNFERLNLILLDAVFDENPISEETRERAWDCMDTIRKIAHQKGAAVDKKIEQCITNIAHETQSPNCKRALGHMRIVQTLRAQGQPAPTPAVS